ncbi:hypothetical protein [Scytonema sp. PCC 10023]|uniref:hypothetical protein n=1 Tax=Scytonema sp. PCC 10023 TaxID=1680591 RepID=UPI0039C5D1C0
MIPKPQRDEQGRVQGEFYPLQKAELIALRKAKLINNAAFVHLVLRYENPYCDRLITVIPKEFALRWLLPESSVYEAIAKLKAAGVLLEWIRLQKAEYTDTERQIRARLKDELGGEVEVITAVGRIDLLTESEVIEIKEINNWKEALGKILAYATFFPEHSKRIHLFGRPDLTKLALAQATCSEFGITVTFEEVEL